MNAGYTFQFVWSLLGLGSLIILIAGKTKRWSVATVLVFIFFSGLDILGCLLTGWDLFNMNISEHIELWSRFQYSSHTTQLFWVYNQAIYAWILTMLIMSEDNKRLVLIWSCGLLECTFPFVGMIPFLVYRIIKNVQWKAMKSQRFSKWTGGLFSFENIMGGGVIGIISFLYLLNNSASLSSSGGVDWSRPANVFVYLLFVFLEAVVYIIAVYRDQKRNPLLWICLLVLLLCPVLRVGNSIDFCMRACIPALLVLCLMVIESLYIAWEGNRRRYFAILAVFLIGAVTPMHELIRTTINTYNLHTSSGETIVYIGEDSVFDSPNFTADAADSFFAQHFMEMDNVWRYGKIDHSGGVIGEITDGHLVEQRFKTYEDITIGSVNVSFATYARTNDCTLDVVMLDPDENMTTLTTIDCNVLQDNTILPIVIEPYAVKKDEWYSVQFISHGAKKGNAVTIYRTKKDKGQDWEYAAIDGKKKKYDLAVGFGK